MALNQQIKTGIENAAKAILADPIHPVALPAGWQWVVSLGELMSGDVELAVWAEREGRDPAEIFGADDVEIQRHAPITLTMPDFREVVRSLGKGASAETFKP